jgi:hypothetical protein
MQAKKVTFNELCDHRGRLIFLEHGNDFPFEIAEVQWLRPAGREAQCTELPLSVGNELLIALNGEVELCLRDDLGQTDVVLNQPHLGMLINKAPQCQIHFLTPNGVVLRIIGSES